MELRRQKARNVGQVEYCRAVPRCQPLNLHPSAMGKPRLCSPNLIPRPVSDMHSAHFTLLRTSSQLAKWQEHPCTTCCALHPLWPLVRSSFKQEITKKKVLAGCLRYS